MRKWLFLIFLLLSKQLPASPLFEVRNLDGKPISIQLLALEGEQVVFSTASDRSKEHTLPLDKFDPASREEIRGRAMKLKPRLPKLGIEVMISRRREKDGYYMVNQTVTAKVKVRNLSLEVPFPKSKGYLAYFGRNRQFPDQYQLMAKRKIDFEVPANQLFEQDVTGIKTRYDSDNKGKGNIGGYQYEGYLFVVTDEDGNVLATKTSDAAIGKILQQDPSFAGRLIAHPNKTILDKNFEEVDPRFAL